MQNIIRLLLITVFGITLTSCGTIFKGSTAEIQVNSSPSGANIFINEIDRGKTPQTMNLDRGEDHLLVFRMEGYEDVRMEINKKFDAGTTIVGNLFSWGVLGVIVDVATGAAYSLTPHDIQANLNKLKEAGIVPESYEQSKNEVMVFMLTKKEWAALQD